MTHSIHLDLPAQADPAAAEAVPILRRLVDQVVAIARLSETDLSVLMGTEQGLQLATVGVTASDIASPERYLRSWDSIAHASPVPLTDEQYRQFLQGKAPTPMIELYGGHLPTRK